MFVYQHAILKNWNWWKSVPWSKKDHIKTFKLIQMKVFIHLRFSECLCLLANESKCWLLNLCGFHTLTGGKLHFRGPAPGVWPSGKSRWVSEAPGVAASWACGLDQSWAYTSSGSYRPLSSFHLWRSSGRCSSWKSDRGRRGEVCNRDVLDKNWTGHRHFFFHWELMLNNFIRKRHKNMVHEPSTKIIFKCFLVSCFNISNSK